MTGADAAADEIRALLDGYGPLAPTLLPWLARLASGPGLRDVARAAAGQAELAAARRWPAVTDAVAELLAGQTAELAVSGPALARILPQLAAYLDGDDLTRVLRHDPRADAVCYAELTHPGMDVPSLFLPPDRWRPILGAARARPVPPLANLRLLTRLVTGPSAGPGDLPGWEAAYLLPHLPAALRRGDAAEAALAEVEDYAADETCWYAAAVCARIAPYLDEAQRVRVTAAARTAPPAWRALLHGLASRGEPWPSPAAELTAAHPALAQLDELASRADPDGLAVACAFITDHIGLEFGGLSLDRLKAAEELYTRGAACAVLRPGNDVAERGWLSLEDSPDDFGIPGDIRGGVADVHEPRPRFLSAELPERAPAGARIALLVQVTLAAEGTSTAMKYFPVSPAGTTVTITVSAPGLNPLGDLDQDLSVPFAADSEQVRFGFVADRVGQQVVRVRAFAGGTCLGDLALEISVENGAALEEGDPRTAPMAEPAAEPGEVTLQVSRTTSGYSFQLLSAALYPVVLVDRLTGDPGTVIEQMIAELRALSQAKSPYGTPELARRRLQSLGAQLWADVVPQTIREQFWAQHDKIKLFTIASDMDTVPWELLYPVDRDNDEGFLAEQFPVVRRVYGQVRERDLRLDRGAGFVVPPQSPANAMDEVAAVRAVLPAYVPDRGTERTLGGVHGLLDAVPSVLHFAGHNVFTDTTGSMISLDGGPLRPSDLAYARQRRAFEAARPFVFFNGCRTAGEIPGFTQLIGWANEFMGAGAGAFIGSLWAVRSSSALVFAREFYNSLVHDGESLGVASLKARRAIAADEGDPTWLAYTVYGNPSASVTRLSHSLPRSSR